MTTESQTDKNNTNDMSLKDLLLRITEWWNYLLSKWKILLSALIIGCIVGGSYAYLKKPIFTATTTFVLEEEKAPGGALGGLGGLASVVGIDIGGGGGIFSGDNILELYRSRTMIKKALLTEKVMDGKKELLIDRFISFNKLQDKWKKTSWEKISFTDTLQKNITKDSVINEIVKLINKNHLGVAKPDKKLSIIRVDVKATDAVFAKNFSDEIVHSVNSFYIDTKVKRSTQNVNILQKKTDSVRKVMNSAINTAANVVDITPNLNPTRQAQRTAPIQRSQFSAETNKAMLSELLKNLEMSKISLLKETPLIQIIDEPTYPLEKSVPSLLVFTFAFGVFFSFLCIIFLSIKKMLSNII